MRRHVLACIVAMAAGAGIAMAGPASAAAEISVKTTFYTISGKSGDALVEAMDRRGPKHGFMTRAIAQTKYSMRSDAMWVHKNGYCRAVNPVVRLDVTYIYPRVEGAVSQAMQARWKRFMRGVEHHEQTHGRIAQEMANAASKAITRVRFADGKTCRQSRARLKQHIGDIVEAYERKQVAFDDIEHQPGGPVDALLGALRK